MTREDAAKAILATDPEELGDTLLLLGARFWREDGRSKDEVLCLLDIVLDDLDEEY